MPLSFVTSRRRFLQVGGVGLSGLSLCGAVRAASAFTAARAGACLLIYLDGGPSHIDLFDLRPHAPDEIRGPFAPIETSVPGTTVCEHLPRVARQMHRLLQVRS